LTTVGDGASPIRSPLNFFLLIFAPSVPFRLAGDMTDVPLMLGLSASALMARAPFPSLCAIPPTPGTRQPRRRRSAQSSWGGYLVAVEPRSA
jgi:hypothetical protein